MGWQDQAEKFPCKTDLHLKPGIPTHLPTLEYPHMTKLLEKKHPFPPRVVKMQEIFLLRNRFRQLRHSDPKLGEAGKPKHDKQFHIILMQKNGN